MSGTAPTGSVALRAVRAEWLKLTGVRSTSAILGLASALGIAVGVLTLHSTATHWQTLQAADRAAFDPVADAFAGFQFTQLAFGALGVLAVTTEYARGTIDTTFLTTPRRALCYLGKIVVLLLLTAPLCQVSAFAALLLGQHQLQRTGIAVRLSDPGVARATICAGLLLSAVTVIGFGLGALLRHTGAALAALVGLVFLAWPVARAVETYSYLPDRWLIPNAADALVTTHPLVGSQALRAPGPAMAGLEIATYVVVLLAAGLVRFCAKA